MAEFSESDILPPSSIVTVAFSIGMDTDLNFINKHFRTVHYKVILASS